MVMDMLGKSIHDLCSDSGNKLSVKTVLMLAEQMISCVEFLHNKNFIHRDIKPHNFVMGRGRTAGQVFIIDYGLAQLYRDQDTHTHIAYSEGRRLSGTAKYASASALRGVQQSRRDNMESLGYVCVWMLKGALSWVGSEEKDQGRKHAKMGASKERMSLEELCCGLPEEFAKYLKIVRQMKFGEQPRYSELRQMFRDLFMKMGYVFDCKYDWCGDVDSESVYSEEENS